MDYEKKIQSLGFTLPPPPKPVATYLPAVRSGNLLFLSGMIPMVDGKMAAVGKLGKELTVEQGQEVARITLLNALSVIKAEIGSLDRVEKIVRIGVHVASAEGFIQQPAVANGASDLLVQIFGEAGRHARLALGAAELPLNAPVELEMIVRVKID
jgi:enamine deaminase RidA (YjgF/YER057c/UK114 family)